MAATDPSVFGPCTEQQRTLCEKRLKNVLRKREWAALVVPSLVAYSFAWLTSPHRPATWPPDPFVVFMVKALETAGW